VLLLQLLWLLLRLPLLSLLLLLLIQMGVQFHGCPAPNAPHGHSTPTNETAARMQHVGL
jgi:hypothetical protein